jgi:hypothetical protein
MRVCRPAGGCELGAGRSEAGHEPGVAMAEVRSGNGVPPLLVTTNRNTHRLVSGRTYTIGRDYQADISVQDPRVSREHAVVRFEDGRWVLEDRGSTNGTFAGGQRIGRLEITGPCAVSLGHPGDGPVLRLAPGAAPTGPNPAAEPPTQAYASPRPAYRDPAPPASAPSQGPAYGNPPAAAPDQGPVHGNPPPAGPSQWPPAAPQAPAYRQAPAPAVGSAPSMAAPMQPEPPREAAGEPGRYLKGQCPGSVRAGETFSVLVSIVREAPGNAPLKYFPVGPGGQDVLLVLHAPDCQVLGRQRQVVHVPPGADSEPVMFELRADSPGPRRISVTAWVGGSYLGELVLEVTAARYRLWRAAQRDTVAVIGAATSEGAVSLVVRHDPVHNVYRFEFRDEDNPQEVTTQLAYEPGPRIEQMLAGLDLLARGRGGYSPAEARDYLVNAGAGLWQELIPAQLREQFWERRDRIKQLTILTDRDAVPWELLYPLDRGHDAGFLVEQFPVNRLVFGRRPSRSLSLSPPRFVLPQGSPPQAFEEITALLDVFRYLPEWTTEPVIDALTPLLDLIRAGDFGLLHFACHNAFDPAAGSAIALDRRQFTPTQLTTAAIGQVLARSAPTVFINACRSAGAVSSYRQLDGWANKFLEAGAGAFIGSQWAVRDSSARDFASELYRHLLAGATLGDAAMRARQAAAATPGDPTWLAYCVYGDPRATVR